MQILPRLPLLALIALPAAAAAQERPFTPLPASADVKTAPEPSRAPDAPILRPELDPARHSAALAAHARPQKPLDPRAPAGLRRAVDHTRMYYDTPGDGSLWVRGAHYKASFDEAGATCFPLFGSKQPQHLPLALTPDAVRRGDTAIPFEHAPAAQRHGDRVELAHGAFRETYDFTPQSVEQRFVFDELPGSGELVLHIPSSSGMQAEPAADALEFHDALGSVRYTRAVALDAAGRRCDAPTAFEDGAITIHVPAEFLAGATLPLTIDPVVSVLPIDDTSFDDFLPDVAFDAGTQRWLAVYQELATAGDGDVYYEVLNAAGASMWGGYVNSNNASWMTPQCANLASATQFLCVSHVNGSGAHSIRGRLIQADIFSISSEFLISGSESGDKINVSVGGDPYPNAPAFYCVAYERVYDQFHDNDILVRLVGPDASLSAINYLSNSGGTLDEFPSVGRSNGGSTWTISWERHDLSANTSSIWAGRVRYDGFTQDGPFQLTSGHSDLYSCASSPLVGSQRTMITCWRDYGTDYDVLAIVLDGAAVIEQENLSILENDWLFQDQRDISCDSDGQHFLVAYSEQYLSSTTDYDVYVSDYMLTGNDLVPVQTHVNLAFTSAREGATRIASTHGAGGANKRYLVAWQRQTSSSNFDVMGALFDGLEGGTMSSFCFGDGTGIVCPCGNYGLAGHGCGNASHAGGALLTASGTPSTVDDTLVLGVGAVPNTATCVFLQGTTITAPVAFGDGMRCAGGSLLRLFIRAAVAGSATYPHPGELPISVRGGLGLDGGLRTYQVWYRDNASFCTSLPYNITNGVQVNWAR